MVLGASFIRGEGVGLMIPRITPENENSRARKRARRLFDERQAGIDNQRTDVALRGQGFSFRDSKQVPDPRNERPGIHPGLEHACADAELLSVRLVEEDVG